MFRLDQVVPWGRSFEEYEKMFALSEADLAQRILGCADGPASFNAQATERGLEVISCDPLYAFESNQIRQRIDVTYEMVMEQTGRNQDEFVWQTIPSLEALGRLRLGAMQRFLADYEGGKRERRYVEGALPTLPFADDAFDLALCSHFLFLYSEHFSQSFHRAAIIEMCRVAKEVRIFPLLALGSRPSPYVVPITKSLSSAGFEVSIETVPYEFQRGGNQMMRVGKGEERDERDEREGRDERDEREGREEREEREGREGREEREEKEGREEGREPSGLDLPVSQRDYKNLQDFCSLVG